MNGSIHGRRVLQRRAAWLATLVTVTAGLAACEPEAPPPRYPEPGHHITVKPHTPDARAAARPPWLGPYSKEQRALLALNPSTSVDVQATPTYPDLRRFSYTVAHPTDSPADVRRFAQEALKDLEALLRDSRRLYVLAPVEPALANTVAQLGPPPAPEPDRWVVTTDTGGEAPRQLAWARPSPAATPHVTQGNRALARRDLPAAAGAFRAAVEASPGVPGLQMALAEVLAAEGKVGQAGLLIKAALQKDDRYAPALLLLADLERRAGRPGSSRRALAAAIATHPVSARAREVAARLGYRLTLQRPPPLFVEVSDVGAIALGWVGDHTARTLAMCRSAMRYEPEFRKSATGESTEGYALSLGEATYCASARLGAHYRQPSSAPDMAVLAADAESGQLEASVLFHVIGTQRPEWLRLAPEATFRRLVAYVETRLLGRAPRQGPPVAPAPPGPPAPPPAPAPPGPAASPDGGTGW